MEHISRRECLALFSVIPGLALQVKTDEPGDWTCPMDPDIRLSLPGKCPRCGMTLVLKVPDRVEYPLLLSAEPRAIQPGDEARLTLRVFDPSGKPVHSFETVHEKLIHLFIVSEDLEFFAHVHPVLLTNTRKTGSVSSAPPNGLASSFPHWRRASAPFALQQDGSFVLSMKFPKPGLYRLLADFYPSGSVPQLAVETLYVMGASHSAHLTPSRALQRSENLTASLRLKPERLLAGLEARIYYSLEPSEGLEKYLGAWGHMLIVSEDTIDLIHSHPFLANGGNIQYTVIFPRAGNYKVWSQFQRLGIVNTIAHSVNVSEI